MKVLSLKCNSSQESITLPPWQLNASREKQKPKLFIDWRAAWDKKKKKTGSAELKGTLFWQASSAPVNHRNTRLARRLNVMRHVVDGNVSFEEETNPGRSPLKHLPLFVTLPGQPCEVWQGEGLAPRCWNVNQCRTELMQRTKRDGHLITSVQRVTFSPKLGHD